MSEGVGFFEILSRALRSRCPVCGKGRLFVRWTRLERFRDLFLPPDHCESCGFQFARQSGYYFGVITPILPILAVLTGLLFAGTTYFAYRPELEVVLGAGAVGVGVGFLAFFRTAIAVYVALDHAIDPPKTAACNTANPQ